MRSEGEREKMMKNVNNFISLTNFRLNHLLGEMLREFISSHEMSSSAWRVCVFFVDWDAGHFLGGAVFYLFTAWNLSLFVSQFRASLKLCARNGMTGIRISTGYALAALTHLLSFAWNEWPFIKQHDQRHNISSNN